MALGGVQIKPRGEGVRYQVMVFTLCTDPVSTTVTPLACSGGVWGNSLKPLFR